MARNGHSGSFRKRRLRPICGVRSSCVRAFDMLRNPSKGRALKRSGCEEFMVVLHALGVRPGSSAVLRGSGFALFCQLEPRSMLHVKETPVPRPRFPVIDFHTHVTWSGELSGEDEVTFKCDSPPRCCRGTARVGSTSRPNGSPAARHSTGTGRPSIRRCGQPSAAGVGRPATNCLRSGFLSECSPRSGHRSCARSPWLWAAG
jgi:hypothetical protein